MATTQFKLLDVVALTEDLPENPLVRGQVGTVVENLAADVYEVEFSDDNGQTYAMLPLHASQLMSLHYLPIKPAASTDNPTTDSQLVTMNQIHQYGQGDNVAGDKIMGDKVAGNKTSTQNQFNGPMSGIIGSELKDNAQASGNTFNQTNNANTTEILQLIANLRQITTTLPADTQEDLIIDIEDVEAEINKPEDQRSKAKLKKRLAGLLGAIAIASAPVAATTDFTNNILDIAEKAGVELPQLP